MKDIIYFWLGVIACLCCVFVGVGALIVVDDPDVKWFICPLAFVLFIFYAYCASYEYEHLEESPWPWA